jgi:photosystem II stability/assembly factor-like uncharacterized protein
MKVLYISLLIFLLPINMFAQWFQQNSGTNNILGRVFFVNEQVGWTKSTYEIYKTTNGGVDWFLQFTNINPIGKIFFNDEDNGWFASFNSLGSELFKTIDGGENWVQVYSGNVEYINDFEFINPDTGWCIGWVEFGYLFIETNDGGLTWIYKTVSPDYWGELLSIEVIDNMNFIIAGNEILFKSTDGGNSWIELPTFNEFIYNLQFFNMNLGWVKAYNINGGLLYKTTNGGNTWNQQVQPMRSYQFITEDNGWYVNNNEIYHSTNGGYNWEIQNSNTNSNLYHIFLLDNNNGWAVGTNGTILYTPNGGLPVELVSFSIELQDNEIVLNWITATETNNLGFEIERKRNDAPWGDLAFVKGNGTTTETQNYSFMDENIKAGKYKYRLKQIDYDGSFEYSKIVEVEVGFPTEFSLEQNYPNPFNPKTKIKYQISKLSFVKIQIYDVLGNEIATLVNEEKPAGSYEAEFNPANLPSGIYFYRIQAGSYSETRKMVLLR